MYIRLFLFVLPLLTLFAAPLVAADRPVPMPNPQRPAPTASPIAALSTPEAQFSQLAGRTLRLLAHDSLNSDLPPAEGSTSADTTTLLQPGDEVTVALRGRTNRTETLRIDAQGRLLLSDIPPVMAAGLSVAQVEALVRQAVTARSIATETYLSMTTRRALRVTVLGAVARPGGVSLPAGADLLDALRAAGGVRPEGSLRAVQLSVGANVADLQSILVTGRGLAPPIVQDGMVVRVPTTAGFVGVTGMVLRPGLLEVSPTATLRVSDALDLVGGSANAPMASLTVSHAGADGGRQRVLAQPSDLLRPGDLLHVDNITARQTGIVVLQGAVYHPGERALEGPAATVEGLLAGGTALTPQAYPLFGLIHRRDPVGMSNQTLVFSPRAVLAHQQPTIPLQDGDQVEIPEQDEIVALAGDSLLQPADRPDWPQLALLADHVVQINGAVRRPGAYPVAGSATLGELIALAGGANRSADIGAIELSQTDPALPTPVRQTFALNNTTALLPVYPGALVLIPERAPDMIAQAVRIDGEVLRPGSYDLQHGERLSSLIQRAGGLSDIAYARGALFRRESVRLAEQQAMAHAADALDQGLAGALIKERGLAPNTVQTARTLVDRLRASPALGRVVVEANPGRLVDRPDLDILLEPGDSIFYPKRPSTVLVTGEVLAGGALQFRSGLQAADYISLAGGTTDFADEERAFVLLPDGSARRLRQSAWNYEPLPILPGSAIIVPQDPAPFRFFDVALPVTGLISQLAVTAASLTIIGR
jgi:polysaccharide biosynthesis/export protein